jgi:HNH endonuclease
MRYITKQLKDLVTKRAFEKCEYCLINLKFSYFPFHIEHIISLKHGGNSTPENLALACPICNLNKGTDLGTILNTHELIRFFNPRTDIWNEHFELDGSGQISPITEIGNATLKIFKMNHPESQIERKELIKYNLI